MKIIIPNEINRILKTLEDNNFQGFIVGGCVRDFLLGKTPFDFDVCTNARPEKVMEIFQNAGYKVFATGLKHGTVTVLSPQYSVEITTFRSEGDYTDNRRPDEVFFEEDVEKDLKRRDFTVNSLAYNEKDGLIDLFGGVFDLENKIIRAVGNPEKRFKEDALRIMRGIRFASTLNFVIEENTEKAMFKLKNNLQNIAFERINIELNKLILGDNVYKVLMEYKEIIGEIIPEFYPCFNFEQCSKHHCYTVYEHIVKSVENAPKDLVLRLTMLFHDIGKPATFRENVEKNHFLYHEIESEKITKNILSRLKYDNKTKKEVLDLILQHDNRYPAEKKSVKKYISKFGKEFFYNQLEIRLADTKAQSLYMRKEKLEHIYLVRKIGEEILAENPCLTIKDLKINGNDLLELGFKGAIIGEILNTLLENVINEKMTNERDILLSLVKDKFI